MVRIICPGTDHTVPLLQFVTGSIMMVFIVSVISVHVVADYQCAGYGMPFILNQPVPAEFHGDARSVRGFRVASVFMLPRFFDRNIYGFRLIDVVDIEFQETVIPVDSVDVLIVAQNVRNAPVFSVVK